MVVGRRERQAKLYRKRKRDKICVSCGWKKAMHPFIKCKKCKKLEMIRGKERFKFDKVHYWKKQDNKK